MSAEPVSYAHLGSSLPTVELAIDEIAESPTNPRRRRDPAKDAELLDSVRKHGVLQPVLVRPGKKGHELVFGSRRFRAAKAAGLARVPSRIRELSDLEVLELQVVENGQREDVHPLDEAEGYRRWHVEHGVGVDEIAAKCGKSRSHVYARLKLLSLAPPVLKAFEQGELEVRYALLIARIPNQERHEEALKKFTENNYRGRELVPYDEAVMIVQDDFMLRLADAPFKTNDADLLPEAGPCTTCPKRTGNQRELFADVKSADICTDSACFKAKSEALWKARAQKAKADGQEVLPGKPSHEKWARMSDVCPEDPKSRTYKQLLGTTAPTALARDDRGKVIEVIERAALPKALRERGHEAAAKKTETRNRSSNPAHPSGVTHDDYNRKWREQNEIRQAITLGVGEAIFARAPAIIAEPLVLWRAIAAFVCTDRQFHADQAAKRRGLKVSKQAWSDVSRKAVAAWAAAAGRTLAELQELVVEVLAHDDDSWDRLAPVAGVDLPALKKEITGRVQGEQKAARAAAKAKAEAKEARASKGAKAKPKKKAAKRASRKK